MSESDDDEEMIYRFKIVRFVKRGRKGPTKEIDIVPSAWISWDEKTKRLKVPFLAPPYTKKNINELHDMVKQESEAPDSWLSYNIDIIGQAKTYTEAIDRLMLLDRTETAFSQDSEDDEEKIKKQRQFTDKKVEKNVDEIKYLFNEIPVFTKKSCSQSDKHKSAMKSKLSEKNFTEKSVIVPTAETSEPEPQPEPVFTKKSCSQSDKHKSAMKSKLSEKNFTEKSIIVPTAKTSEIEPQPEPEPGLSNNQLHSMMLLDTQLPVISENDFMKYTNDKELLSVDIDEIWSKLLMLESESRKMNKKLDLISVKLESLLHDTKVIKNKTINQASSSKSTNIDADNMFLKKYEMILPAKTNEEFGRINVQLDDIEFRTNFCEHLYRYVDFNSTLTKNITMILKICITRDIAITYTATKTTLGKKIMRDEPFYSCIEDIFLQKEFKGEAVSRNGLVKALSAALSNAKDWEGHRKD